MIRTFHEDAHMMQRLMIELNTYRQISAPSVCLPHTRTIGVSGTASSAALSAVALSAEVSPVTAPALSAAATTAANASADGGGAGSVAFSSAGLATCQHNMSFLMDELELLPSLTTFLAAAHGGVHRACQVWLHIVIV